MLVKWTDIAIDCAAGKLLLIAYLAISIEIVSDVLGVSNGHICIKLRFRNLSKSNWVWLSIMYDEEKMQADIEKYGLYSYDDWKDYVSYEEFVALNGQYLTIVIGKGYLTYEDILELIAGMR